METDPRIDNSDNILKERRKLDETYKLINQLCDRYATFETKVNRLESAVEHHPETDYTASKTNLEYDGSGKHRTDIEQDIAVMVGITSENWKELNRILDEVNQNLWEYTEILEDDRKPFQDYNLLKETQRKIRQNVRNEERILEDISVETYYILGEQPSPELNTVLKPDSSKPITSD